VPVKETGVLGWCVGPDAAGRNNTVYISHNQNDAALFLVALNAETGDATQYASPIHEPGAWACCLAADGRIYLGAIGSSGPSQVLRFDPRTETFVSLGTPSRTERYLWTFSPTSDGMIYAGTHGNAKLVAINTKTDELTDLGRLSDADQYTRYTWYGESDRTVYTAVYFTDQHIVAYLRDTGEKMRVHFPGRGRPGVPVPGSSSSDPVPTDASTAAAPCLCACSNTTPRQVG
jgi:outer membrane protein assembly factor BamB